MMIRIGNKGSESVVEVSAIKRVSCVYSKVIPNYPYCIVFDIEGSLHSVWENFDHERFRNNRFDHISGLIEKSTSEPTPKVTIHTQEALGIH